MRNYIFFLLTLCCCSNNLFSQYHNTKKFSQTTFPTTEELSNIWGYTAPDAKEYAIFGTETQTLVYDVTNCAAPVLKTTIIDGSDSYWREYKVYKNFAYMVTEAAGEGLEMFNLTNPNNITFSQKSTPSDSFFFSAHTLTVDSANARLYVSGARPTSGSGSNWLYIYQLSSINIRPTLLKKIQLNTVSGTPSGANLYIHDLYAENNFIYCSHGPDGFGIYDCTDPQNIVFKGIIDSNGYNHSTWRHPYFPNYFYCAEETVGLPMITYNVTPNATGLYSIGITNTFKHPLLAPGNNNNMYHNPHQKGNALYISAYHDGVQIYDMSNPTNPIRAAFYDSYPSNTSYSPSFKGAWGVYPFFNSGCIVVSDINTGFHTFKTHFPKVEITGNIHVTEAGKGIIFRDSSNLYHLLSVSNAGILTTSNVSVSQTEHKLDSADLELKTTSGKIYLTSPNGSKYSIAIDDLGALKATPHSTAITNAMNINGDFILNNRFKGVIMKSPNGQRWKVNVVSNNSIVTLKTAF